MFVKKRIKKQKKYNLLIFCIVCKRKIGIIAERHAETYKGATEEEGLKLSYKNRLNSHPLKIMETATVPKNTPISFHVIAFLSMVASGSERPTTAIMKAMEVPSATPF